MSDPLPHRIREKQHRLPRECYQGEVTVACTVCVVEDVPLFVDASVVAVFVEKLADALSRNQCVAYAYCFMPEHQHIVLHGTNPAADTWRAMTNYKQQTGFWLACNRPTVKWQKDWYDHIVRASEDLGAQIRYVLNNPVRRGLVQDWREHPFSGAIGVDLQAVLRDLGTQ